MGTETAPGVRLIVGLGNPSLCYQDTRHNAGFWFVDRVARLNDGQFRPEPRFFGDVCRVRVQVQGAECWLLKPMTYMNRSGQSVSAFARYYGVAPSQMLVAHDEIDLDPGVVRLKRGGGHAGHNGLRDMVKALDSKDFLRLRLGVGHPGHKDQVVDYVLHRPASGEADAIGSALERAADLLPLILDGRHELAMNRLHGGHST